MAVRALKTELRCKICKSPYREAVDTLLEARSNNEKDTDGRRYNFEYVKELVEEMGVSNFTMENIKSHWGPKKHSYVVTEETATAIAGVRERMLAELPEDASLDQKLTWAMSLFEQQVLAAVESGSAPGITWDQYIKLLGIQNQRKQADDQNELFRSIGVGVTAAFKQLAAGNSEAKALPAADVEVDAAEDEAEVEEAELVDPTTTLTKETVNAG